MTFFFFPPFTTNSSWAQATTERCTHLSPLQPLVALALDTFPALRSLDLRRARPPTAADVASLASSSSGAGAADAAPFPTSSAFGSNADAFAPRRRRILLTSVASALPVVPESVVDAVVFSAAEAVRVAAEKAAAAEEEEEGGGGDGLGASTRPRSADENAEPPSSPPSPPSCPLSLPSTPADDVAAALAAPPMLRELRVCAAAGLTDVGMAKMAATLLRAAPATAPSGGGFGGSGAPFPSSSPALRLPRLVSLTISGASRVTDAGMIALATALAGEEKNKTGGSEEGADKKRGGREALLEELRLPLLLQPRLASPPSPFSSRHPLPPLGGLGDFGARSLARLLPRLRAVDLRGHSRLTPVGVAALAANARCLRALWLGGGGVGGGAAATQRASFDSSSLLDSAASDAGVAAAVVGAGATLELLFVEAPAVSPAVRRQQQRTGGARNRGGAAANAAAAPARPRPP